MRRILILLLVGCSSPPRSEPPGRVRAIWVTRFDYKTEEDVRRVFENAAALGVNTVIFQVRGSADACYDSSLEPRASHLAPGFDPLAVAVEEARRRGLSIHAWINVMPAWRGKKAPEDPGQLYNKRRDWIVVGKDGEIQPLNDHYVCVNPMRAEVRAYLCDVVRDLASKYDVDGIHLDYIRFYKDDDGDYSYDDPSLVLFGFATGAKPDEKPAEWDAFRAAAVTETVRGIRRVLREARPRAMLTAAVFPTAESRARLHQDAEAWAREGLVDAIFTMNYTDDTAEFRRRRDESIEKFRPVRVVAGGRAVVSRDGLPMEAGLGGVPVYPGIGVYKHKNVVETALQLQLCADGFALFSYGSFFKTPVKDPPEDSDELRRKRIDIVQSLTK